MASQWQENSTKPSEPSEPRSVDAISTAYYAEKRRRRDASPAVTYFIQASHGGPIKIGRSTKDGLKSRLKSIQTGHPYPLVVTRTMDGNYEADVHEQFAEHRLVGEWFSPTRDVAQYAGAKAEGETDDHARATFAAGYESGYTAGLGAARHELKQLGDDLAQLRRQTQFVSLKPSASPKDLHAAFVDFLKECGKRASTGQNSDR